MPKTTRDEIRDSTLRGPDPRTSPCFGASDTNPDPSRGARDKENLDFAIKVMEEMRTTPLDT
jgi:hypothetical protein